MPFVFVVDSTPRTYSINRDWKSRSDQELQGLTGCPVDSVCNANGPPTPGLRLRLAVGAADDVAFRYEQALGRIRQVQNFGANSIQRRGVTHDRFILTTFLCTLQTATSDTVLIRSLQHSILGVWLALTQAGVPPASLQTISSPHVHSFVIVPSGYRPIDTHECFDSVRWIHVRVVNDATVTMDETIGINTGWRSQQY